MAIDIFIGVVIFVGSFWLGYYMRLFDEDNEEKNQTAKINQKKSLKTLNALYRIFLAVPVLIITIMYLLSVMIWEWFDKNILGTEYEERDKHNRSVF